jgi:Cu/Zn superoxide dismutase
MPCPTTAVFVVVVACVSFASIVAGAPFPTSCGDRPRLTCFLTPTTAQTLEGGISTVTGQVSFAPVAAGAYAGKKSTCVTRITGAIINLGDSTPHGWHIHEFGDISAPSGSSAGGHYNPKGVDHALPNKDGTNVRHVGDLGNLYPSHKGVAKFDFTLGLDTADVVGRGLIVHAKQDDGGQPTGNSGDRLAQCVLGYADEGAK